MEIFKNRPFSLALSFFLLFSGISAQSILRGASPILVPFLLFCLFFLLVSVAIFEKKRRKLDFYRLFSLSMIFLFALIGFMRISLSFGKDYKERTALDGCETEVVLSLVESESEAVGYTRFRAVCGTEKGKRFPVIFECDGLVDYRPGDVLRARVRFYPLGEIYDDPLYEISEGYFIACTALSEEDPPVRLSEDAFDRASILPLTVRRVNAAFSVRLRNLIGGESGAFSAAILLGDRRHLSEETVRDFSVSGLSHVLAISGLHLGILIGGLAALLLKGGVPRRIRSVLLILLTLLYLMLSGCSMSAMRASFMLAVLYLFGVFYRKPDRLTSLFLAVSAVVALSPTAVFSVGLQMSFLSVFLLLTVQRLYGEWFASCRAKDWAKGRGAKIAWGLFLPMLRLFEAMTVSMTATVAVLPSLYLAFGRVSFLGILANLPVLPLLPGFLFFSLLALLFGGIPYFGVLFARAAGLLGDWILFVAHAFSRLSGGEIAVKRPVFGILIGIAFLLLLLLLSGRERKPARLALLLLPPILLSSLWVIGSIPVNRDSYRIFAVAEGKGETIGVVYRERALLIDLSDGGMRGYAACDRLVEGAGAIRYEAILLAHYDKKRQATLLRFCEREGVKTVYLPFPEGEKEENLYRALLDKMEGSGTSLVCYRRGEALIFFDRLSLFFSKQQYLERSERPIYYLTIGTGRETAVYLSASAEETPLYGEASGAISRASHLLYGEDGPKRKLPLRLPMGADALLGIAVFGEENAAALLESEEHAEILALLPEVYSFEFSD